MSLILNEAEYAGSSLKKFQHQLDEIFSKPDFRVAHEKARPILSEMASKDDTLFEILAACLKAPGFLESRRINPVIALPIFETPNYTLVANCWIPLPDGDTSLSHQSIHHHGNLLLTSVAAFGPGYESFVFAPGFSIDRNQGSAELKLEEIFQHTRGNIEFVGAGAPHVVFYPEKLSITYALWSRATPRVAAKFAKAAPFGAIKPSLRAIGQKLGLAGALGLNQEVDLDFFPENGRFKVLRDRIKYSSGSTQNFLGALRYILFHTGYSRELGESDVVNEFEKSHLLLPKVNLKRSEVLACLR